MQVSLYKFIDNQVVKLEKELSPDRWLDEVNWVEIHSNDRKKVADYLKQLDGLKEKYDFLVNPDKNSLPVTTDKYIIQNFVSSNQENIYKPDYFTIIIFKELIICILPYSFSFFQIHQLQPEHLNKKFDNLRYFFIYELIEKFIAQNVVSLSYTKKQIHRMEEKLMNDSGNLTSQEVMKLNNETTQLTDIFEDQYMGFSVLISLYENFSERETDGLKKFLDNYKELIRIATRLEEKAESLRHHFMIIHQEEATHKINVLTIIQAIFVPLTFIAGVYGMNFRNMPELEWEYGYYTVLGFFVMLAVVSLYFFYKKGWFE